MQLRILPLIVLISLVVYSFLPEKQQQKLPFLETKEAWSDSILKTLTLEEKIGQLFMIAAYSGKTKIHHQQVEKLIKTCKVGGIMFMHGGPVRQANLCNHYQTISQVPLLIAMDAEWGLNMRFDSVLAYPKHVTLGAVKDDSLIYQLGARIGQDLKRMGVHVNFAPCADINSSENPVMTFRSFGTDPKEVAKKATLLMKGMQDQGIIVCAKHFPGHGNASGDSHLIVPTVKASLKSLSENELVPFKQLIESGIGGIMTGHFTVPALDSNKNTIATFSIPILTDMLRKNMHFEGLLFTDALNMKSAGIGNQPGEIEIKSLLAGNDILLCSENVPGSILAIKKAVQDGIIKEEEINRKVIKILKAKYYCGLSKPHEIEIKNLATDLHPPASDSLNKKLAESAITVLKNTDHILPLKKGSDLKILELTIGDTAKNSIYYGLQQCGKVTHAGISFNPTKKQCDGVIDLCGQKDLVLIQMNSFDRSLSSDYSIRKELQELLQKISSSKKSILCVCVSPYILGHITSVEQFKGIIVGYENSGYMQRSILKIISGGANKD